MRATISLVLVLCTVSISSATTIEVPGDFTTIQSAVDNATSADTIVVSDGVFSGPGNVNVELLGKSITIMSANGPGSCTIDCEGSARAFLIHGSEDRYTVVEGFTIANGRGVTGGGICIDHGCATLRRCVFLNCRAESGGALCLNLATDEVEVVNCRFLDCSANLESDEPDGGLGGAVCIPRVVHPVGFDSCVFAGNRALQGGALASSAGIVIDLVRCTLVGNQSYLDGAAMYQSSTGTLVLTQCVLSMNRGPLLVDCTWGQDQYELYCCDLFGNDGGDYVDCLGPHYLVDGNFSDDPRFCNPGVFDFSLQSSSPCGAALSPCGETIGAAGTDQCLAELPLADHLGFESEDATHLIGSLPTITWQYEAATSGEEGQAYQIEVGVDDEWTIAEMWSSGVVAGSGQSAPYEGPELADGQTYFMRVRVEEAGSWGSWSRLRFRTNYSATCPAPVSPVDGSEAGWAHVYLQAATMADSDGDPLSYDFQVYGDESLTSLVASFDDLRGQDGLTTAGPVTNLVVGNEYWWRVRSYDTFEYSDWSGAQSFTVAPTHVLHVPYDYGTIQEAVDASGPWDTVLVHPGTYAEQVVLDGPSIVLKSSDGPAVTTLSPPQAYMSIVLFQPSEFDSSHVVSLSLGGAVLASAVYVAPGNSPTFADCEFVGNVAHDGAGMMCLGVGTAIRECSFMNNSVSMEHTNYGEGAGIYIRGRQVTVDGCRFFFNTAEKSSASVYMQYSSDITLSNNVVFDNTAGGQGSGFTYAYECHDLVITGNTVVNNRAAGRGSGVSLWGTHDVSIRNNLFAFNETRPVVWADDESCSELDVDCNVAYPFTGGDFTVPEVGPGTIYADPYFCGYHSGDQLFTVREQSVCLPENNSCGVLIGALGLGEDCTDYLCGDVNGDEALTWDDIEVLTAIYFENAPLPSAAATADPNCNGIIGIDDICYLVAYLRGDGAQPCCSLDLLFSLPPELDVMKSDVPDWFSVHQGVGMDSLMVPHGQDGNTK